MRTSLPSPAEKPRYVAAMFARIARRYDLMNTLMTGGLDRAWRRAVAARVGDAEDVLDVGTGTGRLAQVISRGLPAANVVGVDFTEAMLRQAPPALRLASADALQLPFKDGQFDAVVSAFVMRNLADVRSGVVEQARVLRPGGRLVILETTPGPAGLLRPAFSFYFRKLVPILGKIVGGDAMAYTYLPESTAAFLEPERLADLLREQGLADVGVQRLALGSVAITSGRAADAPRPGGNT